MRQEFAQMTVLFRITFQGGIISPTIMNMVLDGLENVLKKHFTRWKGQKFNDLKNCYI